VIRQPIKTVEEEWSFWGKIVMAIADSVICIPAFRRPKGLERCLRSLEGLAVNCAVRIIVADNDIEQKQGIEVCERLRREGFRFPITTLSVEARGIAPTRNALVMEAIKDPDTRLIAMIDDDEWAMPNWLSELLIVQANCKADVVGGPVLRNFEIPVPDYIAKANKPNYNDMFTGPVDIVESTCNILFNAQLFRERPGPWFDPAFALTGGEDMDFLLGLKLTGKTFAWAQDAILTEEMPISRCSAKWMIQRAYRVGNTDMLIKLKHRPLGFNFVTECVKIIGAASATAADIILFAWHPERRFEGVRRGSRTLGKLVAAFGVRHKEYKIIHGN
jgi:succinoglycan biosynthesis protein ExoM